jgi:pyridoxal phosphate enzyme (YggS family)
VPVDPAQVTANLAAVRRRVEGAARGAGRDATSVRLVAVSKMFPAVAVRAAAAAGQVDFGENKVQEGLQKIADTSELPLRWHLIGHLQSNKARRAAAVFQAIHSIDSVDLLRRVDAAAAETGTAPELLVQVDLAGEATKFGVPESAVQAVFETNLRAARLTGLMLLPPEADNPEDARPWFQRLRELRDRLASAGVPADCLRELSMGMSHDFEVAVQEGSTIVRIGTAIFGQRRPAPRQEITP